MFSNKLDEIIPGLFISDWKSSDDFHLLQQHNIKAIITVETRPKDPRVLEFYKRSGIDFMYIYAYDSPEENISRYFDLTADFISYHLRRKQNVLVHCWAGISRSASILLNFLNKELIKNNKLYKSNITAKSVIRYNINFVRLHRPFINPNYGFINQLYEKCFQYLL